MIRWHTFDSHELTSGCKLGGAGAAEEGGDPGR